MTARSRRRAAVGAALALVLAGAAGCAPQQDAEPGAAGDAGSADAGASAVEVAWSADAACESCHEAEAAARTDATSLHAAHADEACLTCHDDEEGLTAAHATYTSGTPATKLKKTDVARASCLASGCHDQAALVDATAESTVLTDTKGTVANPHDLPAHKDHDEGVTCASCHAMHGEGTADAAVVEQASQAACLSCHHAGVYECHTCHT